MNKIIKSSLTGIFTYIILSLFLNNIFQSSMVEAAQEIALSSSLPEPTACAYDDSTDPLDPTQCLVMMNNGNTGGLDNIFFTLNALEDFDTFTCTLLNSLNQPVDDPTAGDCKTGPTSAQVEYNNLDGGEYTFYVVGTKKGVVTTNTTGLIKDVVIQSPNFNFIVGTAESGGVSGVAGSESAGVDVESNREYFYDILENSNFYNLKYFLQQNKTTTTQSPTSVACFINDPPKERFGVQGGSPQGGSPKEAGSFAASVDTAGHEIREISCNSVIIFDSSEGIKNSDPIHNFFNISYANIYSLKNSLNKSLANNLLGCGAIALSPFQEAATVSIYSTNCEDYFIAFPANQ